MTRAEWAERWSRTRERWRGRTIDDAPPGSVLAVLQARREADEREESEAHERFLAEAGLILGRALRERTRIALRACRLVMAGRSVMAAVSVEMVQFPETSPDRVYLAAVSVWRRERARGRAG